LSFIDPFLLSSSSFSFSICSLQIVLIIAVLEMFYALAVSGLILFGVTFLKAINQKPLLKNEIIYSHCLISFFVFSIFFFFFFSFHVRGCYPKSCIA
jgi:hypothetical protein